MADFLDIRLTLREPDGGEVDISGDLAAFDITEGISRPPQAALTIGRRLSLTIDHRFRLVARQGGSEFAMSMWPRQMGGYSYNHRRGVTTVQLGKRTDDPDFANLLLRQAIRGLDPTLTDAQRLGQPYLLGDRLIAGLNETLGVDEAVPMGDVALSRPYSLRDALKEAAADDGLTTPRLTLAMQKYGLEYTIDRAQSFLPTIRSVTGQLRGTASATGLPELNDVELDVQFSDMLGFRRDDVLRRRIRMTHVASGNDAAPQAEYPLPSFGGLDSGIGQVIDLGIAKRRGEARAQIINKLVRLPIDAVRSSMNVSFTTGFLLEPMDRVFIPQASSPEFELFMVGELRHQYNATAARTQVRLYGAPIALTVRGWTAR